ncbi:hypothetical protein VI06_13135 [Aquitalea magnusonii]|nr:hypothetical protein VI06_13135 [Aquitalea magnusonii]
MRGKGDVFDSIFHDISIRLPSFLNSARNFLDRPSFRQAYFVLFQILNIEVVLLRLICEIVLCMIDWHDFQNDAQSRKARQ